MLTAPQLAEWEAYNELEPIGAVRNDYMLGQLSAIVINLVSQIYKAKGSTPTTVKTEEFIPWWPRTKVRKGKRVQSPEDIKEIFRQLKANMEAGKKRDETNETR